MSEGVRFPALALAALAVTMLVNLADAAAPCNRSLLTASASIDFIEPEGATLEVRHNGLPPRQLSVGACLVPDDDVILPPTVTLARVFAGDRLIDLTSNQPRYHVAGGIQRVTQAMATFVSAFANVLANEPAADLPRPTATRTLRFKMPGATRSIVGLDVRNIAQKMPGTDLVSTLVVAWHAPPGQAHCGFETLDSATSQESASPWCAVGMDSNTADGTLRISFDEPRLEPLTWQIMRVPDDQVPRPEWMSTASPSHEPTVRALWGLWLFREAPPEWRLAGLGMLYSNRESSWIAARAYRLILVEDLRLAPLRPAASSRLQPLLDSEPNQRQYHAEKNHG